MDNSFKIILTFFLAVILFVIHSFSNAYFYRLNKKKYFWLSFFAGVSVSYVFIHIFPELGDAQDKIEKINNPLIHFLDYHIYLISLFGFTFFYGLESAARISKQKNLKLHNRDYPAQNVFSLHLISFAAYNLLIGYFLLHREVTGINSLLFYFIAMATHIVINDYSLRKHFKEYYLKTGRWVLSASVLIGWLLGVFFDVPEIILSIMFAFLAGGMILNIIKEELPEEKQSKFYGFTAGCLVYSILLIVMG